MGFSLLIGMAIARLACSMKQEYPNFKSTERITDQKAWDLAGNLLKCPPYRGYALDLGNNQLLSHFPDGHYYLVTLKTTNQDKA